MNIRRYSSLFWLGFLTHKVIILLCFNAKSLCAQIVKSVEICNGEDAVDIEFSYSDLKSFPGASLNLTLAPVHDNTDLKIDNTTWCIHTNIPYICGPIDDENSEIEDCASKHGYDSETINQQTCAAIGCCFDPTSTPKCRNYIQADRRLSNKEVSWSAIGECHKGEGVVMNGLAGFTATNIFSSGVEHLKLTLQSNACNNSVSFTVDVQVCDLGYKLNKDTNTCEPYCTDITCFCADYVFKQQCIARDCPVDMTFDGTTCVKNSKFCNATQTSDCFWNRNPCQDIEGFRYNGSMCILHADTNVTCNEGYQYSREQCTTKLNTDSPTATPSSSEPTVSPTFTPTTSSPTRSPTLTKCLPYEEAPPGDPESCYCGDKLFDLTCPTCTVIPDCPLGYVQTEYGNCVLNNTHCTISNVTARTPLNITPADKVQLYKPGECSNNTSLDHNRHINQTLMNIDSMCFSRCSIGYEFDPIRKMCVPIHIPSCYNDYWFDFQSCSVKSCNVLRDDNILYGNLTVRTDSFREKIVISGSISKFIVNVTVEQTAHGPKLQNPVQVDMKRNNNFNFEFRSMEYNNLQPGQYGFNIKLTTVCGNITEEIVHFEIQNLPPIVITEVAKIAGLTSLQLSETGTSVVVRESNLNALANATLLIDARQSFDPEGTSNLTLIWTADQNSSHLMKWSIDGLPYGVIRITSMKHGEIRLNLQATDSHGGVTNITYTIFAVTNKPPLIDVDASLQTHLTMGSLSEAILHANVTDDGHFLKTKWTIVDHNASTSTPYILDPYSVNTRLTNLEAHSKYTLLLVVTDDEGLSTNETVEVTVDDKGTKIGSFQDFITPVLYQNQSTILSWTLNEPYNANRTLFSLDLFDTEMNKLNIARNINGKTSSYQWNIPFLSSRTPKLFRVVLSLKNVDGTPTRYHAVSTNITIRLPISYFMGPYQPCSEKCTIGFQTRELKCFDSEASQVPKAICDWVYGIANRPQLRRPCFTLTSQCDPQLDIRSLSRSILGEWSDCEYKGNVSNICETDEKSLSLDNITGFMVTRNEECFSVVPGNGDSNDDFNIKTVECPEENKNNLPCNGENSCNKKKNRFQYMDKPAEELDSNCVCSIDGIGVPHVTTCIDTFNNIPVLESNCIDNHKTRSPSMQLCNLDHEICNYMSWRIGPWEATNFPLVFREVKCYDEISKHFVEDEGCAHIGKKPNDARNMHHKQASLHKSVWITSKWSECSLSTCEMTRDVTCINFQDPYDTNPKCSSATRPENISICNEHDQKHCLVSWQTDGYTLLNEASGCRSNQSVVQADGTCCNSPNSVLDKEGNCCESGILDPCGICNGQNILDINGVCCDGTLDASGNCCSKGSTVDECGICEGIGRSCAFMGRIGIPSLPLHNFSQQFNPFSFTAKEIEYLVAEDIGLGNSVTVEFHYPAQGNIGTILIFPSNGKLGGWNWNDTSFNIVESLLESRKLHNRSLGDYSYYIESASRTGLCGNGFCEVGEIEFAGTQYRTSCKEDCSQNIISHCPRSSDGKICAGHGSCMLSSGQCSCFGQPGYAGSDCSTCKKGWVKIGSHCIATATVNASLSDPTLPTYQPSPESISASNWLDLHWKELLIGVSVVIGVLLCCCFMILMYMFQVSRRKPSSLIIPTTNMQLGQQEKHHEDLSDIHHSVSPSSAELDVNLQIIEKPRTKRQHGVKLEGWLRKKVGDKWGDKQYYVLYYKNEALTFYSGMAESSHHNIYIGELGSLNLQNLVFVRSEPRASDYKYKDRIFQIGLNVDVMSVNSAITVIEFMARTKADRQAWIECLSYHVGKYSKVFGAQHRKNEHFLAGMYSEHSHTGKLEITEDEDSDPEMRPREYRKRSTRRKPKIVKKYAKVGFNM